MKPLWLASIVFTATLSSYAQQPCAADPNAAKNESTRFDNEEFNIKQQEIQANTDNENAKLRCKDSQTVAKLKANIDSQSAVDECNITGQTPAEKQENLRHFHAEYETSGSTDESRKTCLKNNEKSYASDQVNLQIDRNHENATHTKNLMSIQRTQQQPK